MPGLSIPEFQIPASQSVLGISIIDTTVRIQAPLNQFALEEIPGNEFLDASDFSFLLEHPSGQKLVFDLGFRPDYQNLPPDVINPILELVEQGDWSFSIEKDVATILEEGGVDRADIDAVIIRSVSFICILESGLTLMQSHSLGPYRRPFDIPEHHCLDCWAGIRRQFHPRISGQS